MTRISPIFPDGPYHPDQMSPRDLLKRRYKVDAPVIISMNDIHREDVALGNVVG